MPIWIDSREGSKDLARYIRPQSLVRLKHGLPTDVMFSGNGPNNQRLVIGIEHKRIGDVLACIIDGRFAGTQLPLLTEFHFYWLFVEGLIRCNDDTGRLEIWYRGDWRTTDRAMIGSSKVWMWREFEGWLTTMEVIAGVKVRFFKNKQHSADAVVRLYHWWNAKDWDEHRSHIEIDDSHVTMGDKSDVFQFVIGRPGAHMVTAAAAETEFRSIRRAANASVEEWAELKIGRVGKRKRRVGVKVAKRIVESIEREAE